MGSKRKDYEGAKLNICIFHPSSSTNLGDLFILKGTEGLLADVFEQMEIQYCDLNKVHREPALLDTYHWKEVDLFVLSGTPWIWDMCYHSLKYNLLWRICSELLPKTAKKVALGIGSNFPFATNMMQQYVFEDDPTKRQTRDAIYQVFSTFDLITTRDRVAWHTLKYVGVDAFDGICPAVHFRRSPKQSFSERKPLLVFTNPYDGASRESCDKLWMDDFIQFQKWFREKYDPRVITMEPLDRDWCVGQNWDVEWLKHVDDLFGYLDDSTFVVSGRVHAAIPAAVHGIRSYILPIDSRYLAAQRVGVTPLLTLSDMDWWHYSLGKTEDGWWDRVQCVVDSDYNFVISKLKELF